MDVDRELVSDFNTQSLAQGWGLHCSPCDAFDNPLLLTLRKLWIKTAAGRPAPSKNDFSIRVLAPHLGHVSFIERVNGAPRRYRLRFFGSILATITGDHTGKYLDDVLPPSGVQGWTTLYDLFIDTSTPLRVRSNSILAGLDHLSAKVYLAPLAADGELPRGVLGACLFGPR
jgi:hypothetical protein